MNRDLDVHRGFTRLLSRLLLLLGLTLPAICVADKIALTFDDLPLNGSLPAGVTEAQIARDVVAILRSRHVPPSYGFINAEKLEGNPTAAEGLKIWHGGGQLVGNHTYSHMDLHQNATEAFASDIARNETALELLAAPDEWRWFRYPYLQEGDTLEKRRAMRKHVLERGYQIAQVTIDYEDYLWNFAYPRCVERGDTKAIEWMRSTYMQAASEYLDHGRALARQLYGRDISHVLLLHLGSFSSDRVPALLDLLHKKGFQLVTLQEAQSDPIYQVDPDIAIQTGGSLLDQFMEARKLPYPKIKDKPREELEQICR